MFQLADEMNTASAGAFFKALGNRLVAHACRAARNDVLAKKRLALPWDDEIPTLDGRNEQDEDARGEADRRNKAEGTETESNAAGYALPITAIARCELLVGLVGIVRDECAAYSSQAFDQPQTFEGYIKFVAGLDKPFNATEAEKQADQELITAGLLTEEDCVQDRVRQVDRVAAPYRQYGSEILQVLNTFVELDGRKRIADETWFDDLPKWEQLQLIEETAAAMKGIARQKALQSKRPRFGVGVDTEGLKADAFLILKDVEQVAKYRVEFYKLHKQELDDEDLARQAARALPASA